MELTSLLVSPALLPASSATKDAFVLVSVARAARDLNQVLNLQL